LSRFALVDAIDRRRLSTIRAIFVDAITPVERAKSSSRALSEAMRERVARDSRPTPRHEDDPTTRSPRGGGYFQSPNTEASEFQSPGTSIEGLGVHYVRSRSRSRARVDVVDDEA